ncbi:MAG: methionine--tRNA ligase [Aeriscardovia sp.]|nr:methionine--tRNA ligase [Aeriscardovia sp.]
MTHILVAVAWPYANGPRHIGHIAGFAVPSDIFARYQRMKGNEVLMVSGTDEHGTPILVQAEKEGMSPEALSLKYHKVITEDLRDLGMSYDIFTRTRTETHREAVQELFRSALRNGYVYLSEQKVAISPSTGRTLPDRYIEGTCPFCGAEDARGDQCDECGKELDPTDLLNPRSKIDGSTPIFTSKEHYFLDLPALKPCLEKWLEGCRGWRGPVMAFAKSLLKDPRPRAITRDIDWGVPLPEGPFGSDPSKRFYVWFDALVGYLSSCLEWSLREGREGEWEKWWKDGAESYYFMGKDNITFHTEIWPAVLMASGGVKEGDSPSRFGKLSLPSKVVASGFMTMKGAKFSSSRGVVVYLRDLLKICQPDAVRYFIASCGPEKEDADFSFEELERKVNGELVASWGNLVNRVCTLIYKNWGEIPDPEGLDPRGEDLLKSTLEGFGEVGGLIGENRLHEALSKAMRLAGDVNRYLSESEPWKKGEGEQKKILFAAAQGVCDINVMLSPFLPFSSPEVFSLLALPSSSSLPKTRKVEEGGEEWSEICGPYECGSWARRELCIGAKVPKPRPLFKKFEAPSEA